MKKTLLYGVIALVIGGFFFWLAARELPIDEVAEALDALVWGEIAPVLLATFVLYSISHFARVWRWYYLVRPIAEVDARGVAEISTVGFAAILLFPMRLGEFVRPVLLARHTAVPMSAGLGTAVVERVMDGLVITGLLFLTLTLYSGDASTSSIVAGGIISASVFIPAFTVCLMAWFKREWTMRWVNAVADKIPGGIGHKAAGMLDAFILGLKGVGNANTLGAFIGLSAVYWGFNALSMWCLASYGFGLEIGPLDALTMLCVLVVGIMIPAGPAMAGNFQFFVMLGAGLFVSLEQVGGRVGAFAAILHVLQFSVIVLPALAVSALGANLGAWWRIPSEQE